MPHFKIKHLLFSLTLLPPLTLFSASALAEVEPGERCFTITGYYSPLPPDQQRIYSNEGSDQEAYEKEKRLNGQGVRTADGTAPYLGVVAAPSAYPFGTRIGLDGIGVFTVRDRGGAIVEAGERGYSCDRIDVYTGSGEEGLAKALHLGKRTLQGQIYASGQAPEESVDLSWVSTQLPSRLLSAIGQNASNQEVLSPIPFQELTPIPSTQESGIEDDVSLAEKLTQLGYADLTHFQVDHGVIPTADSYGAGVYGPKTQSALSLALKNKILKPTQIPIAEKEQVAEKPTPVQQNHWLEDEKKNLQPGLNKGTKGEAVKSLQVILSQLNLYHQPVNGEYDEATETAVFEFQKMNGVVAGYADRGAGVYGPKTNEVMQMTLEERVQKLNEYPQEVEGWMPKKQELPALNQLTLVEMPQNPPTLNFALGLKKQSKDPLAEYRHLKVGDRGAEVVELQNLLIEKGLLETGLNTGYYGEKTQVAVSQFKG